MPIIKSNNQSVSIQEGEVLKKDGWRLVPEANPDVYEVSIVDGKPIKVTFITDVDRISFDVKEGNKYDFIIQWGDKLCYTQIVGVKFIPPAVFDQKYQAAHRGKTFVEIPEIYELVNVAIAMTKFGIEDKNLVYKKSDYYQKMRQWFDKYQDHPVLTAFDNELRRNIGNYFNYKMDSYSFEFDNKGKIVQSKVYDRTAWGKNNSLRPFLEQLQSFAGQTNFRKFYRENKKTYAEQIAFYRDQADITEMKRWLDKNFPTSSNYDAFKVIFSPLVAYNQSANWFENNGFKELHAQVNFPYAEDVAARYIKGGVKSKTAETLVRGNIVFTELNHGYINPEADKYAERILKATSNRDHWVDKEKGPGYYGGISAFNEYMNWGLVSLRITDYVPREEQDFIISKIEEMMVKGRGFPQFAAFDQFLVNLYRNRKPEQTIADLYPQIIEWFEKNNQPSSDDREAVRQAAMDYIESIYNVDPTLVERSVHPDLAKRGFFVKQGETTYTPHIMTFDQLIDLAKNYNKNGRIPKDAPKEVTIFEVSDQTASVKVTASWGIDYLHLAKYGGQWKIVNILWQSHPKKIE